MKSDLNLLRQKIWAVENQNRAFYERLRAFNAAPLWKRLMMALKGGV